MIQPFIAAITDAITLIAEKKLFQNFKDVSHQTFSWWLFFWIVIIGLLLSPWLATIDPLALSAHYLWLLLALAFLAANYNLLLFFGIKREKVSNIEPFLLFNPIVTILIAGLFYADERFWQIYIAAVIAAILLVWSNIKKHHFNLSTPLLAIIGFSLLYGLEAVVIKQLLVVYSPLALYLIRAAITVLFLWMIQRGKIAALTLKQLPYVIFIAAGAVLTSTLIYYAYSLQGISVTIFALTLSPVVVYAFSTTFLKEKLGWRNVVTSLVILLLVVWVTLSR